MKQIYLLAIAIFFSQLLAAQDLASHIPGDAKAVVTFNMASLSKLMTPEQLDQTIIGKKLRELKGKDSSSLFNSVQDFGANLNSKAYYFYMSDDSMHYNMALVPLTDARKLDKVLSNKEILRLPANVRKVAEKDSSGYIIWNDQQMLYVNATLKDAYFRRKEVAINHGLSDYYDYNVTVDSVYAMDTSVVEIVEDAAVAAVDSATTAMEEISIDTSSEETTIYTDGAIHEGTFDYYNDMAIKKRISAARAAAVANRLFFERPPADISSNASYAGTVNNEAVASFWIDKPMDLYYNMLPTYPFAPGKWLSSNGADKADYTKLSGHLLMNQQQLRLHTDVELTKEMAAIQQSLLDRKINKRFYKYINTDSMMGYMSWAINTKNYLQEIPGLMERTYGRMGLGLNTEEYGLMSEFFSLVVDEEAIAKMVKGDMMVLFDGVYQQETTYTDYNYNDNFEETPVIKTKKETLPRFLVMASSEQNNLARKLVQYGIKKNIVKANGDYFEIEMPNSPVRLYFMYKDDIFFLTNSASSISGISTGNFKSNISRSEKRFIADHNFSMYINPKNLATELSTGDIAATEGLTEMINVFNKMGVVRVQLNEIKNNVSSSDISMDVPAGNTNALSLLLSFFEGWLK